MFDKRSIPSMQLLNFATNNSKNFLKHLIYHTILFKNHPSTWEKNEKYNKVRRRIMDLKVGSQ